MRPDGASVGWARKRRSGPPWACCAPGLPGTGFRGRSTPTGKMSTCGGRMRRNVRRGAAPFTQFGRMCAKLGIGIIPASSPQAKGRIERQHGTHQDRLVKKLRRIGIADVAAANAFLEAAYWADHNRRFARAPASPDDFHRAVPARLSLDHVFRLEDTRTVSNDWVVRYANRHFQLERQSQQPPARGIVHVFEDPAGHIEIRYR